MELPPFNGDWPSSVFASQDPVAIDSVGYDFVNAEWPDVVRYGHAPAPKYDMQGGAEDYLHEAALANDPCSGTFYDPDHPREEVRLGESGRPRALERCDRASSIRETSEQGRASS